MRRLIRANPREAARQLRAGAEQAAYDIWAIPPSDRRPDFLIHVASGAFSPAEAEHDTPPGRSHGGVQGEVGWLAPYIVQFSRPLSIGESLQLIELGATPIEPVSDSALVYLLPESVLPVVKAFEFVRWVGAWRPEYKIRGSGRNEGKPLLYVRCLGPTATEYRNDLRALGFADIREPSGTSVYIVPAGLDVDPAPIASLWWVREVARVPIEGVLQSGAPYDAMDSRRFVLSTAANEGGYDGTGVTLGVYDSGVYASHGDLAGIFVSASDLTVQADHGTHVIGIAAGRGAQSKQSIRGVAHGASVLFRQFGEDILTALDIFRSNGATVSNHSWCYIDYCVDYGVASSLFDQYADDYGLVLVAAAGNENAGGQYCSVTHQINDPASGKNVITVGALDFTVDGDEGLGVIATYSSRGPTLGAYHRLKPDLVAPGGSKSWTHGVVAPNGSGTYGVQWPEFTPFYTRASGTSMAAPHVTGSLGLLKEAYPTASSETLKAKLVGTAIALKGNSATPLNGYANTTYGYGSANALLGIFALDQPQLLWAHGSVEGSSREYVHAFTPGAGTKKVAVTLAFNDTEGNGGHYNYDLDFAVVSPSGKTYCSDANNNSGWTGCTYRLPYPAGVNAESPVEKMLIDEFSPGDIGARWYVVVRLSAWPATCVWPCEPSRDYGIFVQGQKALPALQVTVSGSPFPAGLGETVTVPITVQNTGGYVVPAVDVSVSGNGLDSAHFAGPLVGQGDTQTVNVSTGRLTTPGIFTYTARAAGVNLGLADATTTFSVSVLGIMTDSPLPWGSRGVFYSQTLDATGGTTPYTWTLSPGYSLPAGLSLSSGGIISGTPTTVQTSFFMVRLTDSGGRTNDKQFSLTIYALPGVTVAAPNGGEKLYTGTPYTISWTASDSPPLSFFDVFYSTNSGSTYTPVPGCSGVPGTERSCVWTAPGPTTSYGRIRVTAHDAAGNAASDASDANHSVIAGTASIAVTAPNTITTWTIGASKSITWSHNLGTNACVRIELSRDAGTTWETLNAAFKTTSSSSGTYPWIVTGPATAQGLVRITGLNEPVSDTSDVPFTIANPTVTVTQPNSALKWLVDTVQQIKWSHTAGLTAKFRLELSRDGGATYPELIAAEAPATTASSGVFNWTVTHPASTTARVRVTMATIPAVTDVSNVNFSIVDPIVTVTQPNTALNWAVGSTQQIKWSHNVGTGAVFTLEVSRDGGATYPEVITTSAPATSSTSGTYNWLVTGPPSTQARVRVSYGGVVSDASNVNFTIADPYITLTSPTSSTKWGYGTAQKVSWSTNLSAAYLVNVLLSTDGGVTFPTVLASNIAASVKSATFTVPTLGAPTTLARVRVELVTNPAVGGTNPANFRVDPPYVTVTAPSGASTIWLVGTSRSVTWSQNLGSLESVMIELSLDGGATYPIVLLPSTPSDGSQSVVVQAGWVTTQGRVRVTWLKNGAVRSVSAADFKIQ
jgi:subtilisin family serine protease